MSPDYETLNALKFGALNNALWNGIKFGRNGQSSAEILRSNFGQTLAVSTKLYSIPSGIIPAPNFNVLLKRTFRLSGTNPFSMKVVQNLDENKDAGLVVPQVDELASGNQLQGRPVLWFGRKFIPDRSLQQLEAFMDTHTRTHTRAQSQKVCAEIWFIRRPNQRRGSTEI